MISCISLNIRLLAIVGKTVYPPMFPLFTPYDRKRIRFDALRPIRTIIPLDFNEFLSVRYIVSIALQSYTFQETVISAIPMR